eukprot:826652_1
MRRNGNVIQLIAKHMTNLKRLAISTSINSDDGNGDIINITDRNNISQHTQLKTLKLSVMCEWTHRIENTTKYVNAGFLQFLFSTFIGVTRFEYDFHDMSLGIDWDHVLATVIERKRMYSMNKEHDALPPLESLQFKQLHYKEGARIMKSILHLQYCDLKHIGMEFESGVSTENINRFSKQYFVPFLRLYQSKNANLSSVHLNLGYWYSSTVMVRELPLFDILSNIPPSVTTMHLELPEIMQENLKKKLVKKLCEMSLETNEGSKLETISFDHLKLSSSQKKK